MSDGAISIGRASARISEQTRARGRGSENKRVGPEKGTRKESLERIIKQHYGLNVQVFKVWGKDDSYYIIYPVNLNDGKKILAKEADISILLGTHVIIKQITRAA